MQSEVEIFVARYPNGYTAVQQKPFVRIGVAQSIGDLTKLIDSHLQREFADNKKCEACGK